MENNKNSRHVVVSIEPHMTIVHASQISVDDLICIGKLLGAVE